MLPTSIDAVSFYWCHKFVFDKRIYRKFPSLHHCLLNWVCIHGMMTWKIFSVHLICIKHFVVIYFHANSSPCISYYVCSFLVSFFVLLLFTNDLKYVLYATPSLQYLNEHKGKKERDEKEKGSRKMTIKRAPEYQNGP